MMTADQIVKSVATLVIAIVLAWAFASREEASGQVPPLPTSVYDERLSDIDRLALDDAYRRHVERMFDGWMRDPTGQPTRALMGIRNGRKAYIDAMTAIDARTPGGGKP